VRLERRDPHREATSARIKFGGVSFEFVAKKSFNAYFQRYRADFSVQAVAIASAVEEASKHEMLIGVFPDDARAASEKTAGGSQGLHPTVRSKACVARMYPPTNPTSGVDWPASTGYMSAANN